jgi:hypothetical protein
MYNYVLTFFSVRYDCLFFCAGNPYSAVRKLTIYWKTILYVLFSDSRCFEDCGRCENGPLSFLSNNIHFLICDQDNMMTTK